MVSTASATECPSDAGAVFGNPAKIEDATSRAIFSNRAVQHDRLDRLLLALGQLSHAAMAVLVMPAVTTPSALKKSSARDRLAVHSGDPRCPPVSALRALPRRLQCIDIAAAVGEHG